MKHEFRNQDCPQGNALPQTAKESESRAGALQRLLDVKGPVRQQRREDGDFLKTLDEVLVGMGEIEDGMGWLDGSMSGQSWRVFMEDLRIDLLTRLQQYRDRAAAGHFNPASLATLKAERHRIERLYIRDMVSLYQQASQTFKSLSG